jgi:hypothetical protein
VVEGRGEVVGNAVKGVRVVLHSIVAIVVVNVTAIVVVVVVTVTANNTAIAHTNTIAVV